MSVSYFPQPIQLMYAYKVVIVARINACIQHHDVPLTKAHKATTDAEYADSQKWASLMSPQTVTIPVAD